MELTNEQLEQVEEFAALFMTMDEIATMLEISPQEFRRLVRNRNSEISKKYHKGKLQTMIELRRNTKLFAEKGSPQAEQHMKEYLAKMENNE